MSNASDCYPVAKSHQDHQDSQSEILRTLRFKMELLSPAISVACGFTLGCVTMLSDSQGSEHPDFALIFILQLRHTRAGIPRSHCMQYATAHAFSGAAMKLTVCC